jgi:hypothetical protein
MGLILPADFLAKVDDIACYESSDRFVVAAGIVPVLSGIGQSLLPAKSEKRQQGAENGPLPLGVPRDWSE